MAFSISQDVDWAFAGKPVTLEASSGSGNRARFKLTAKPYDSALELYDAGDLNYIESRGLQRCLITPDTPGVYTITGIDENVTTNVKHFVNDGSTGASKGIETVSALASASHSLIVGQVLQRVLGHERDTITLTTHVHGPSAAAGGVMTYYAGAGYIPTLTGSTTPRMSLAQQATAVTQLMGYYGGTSDTSRDTTVTDTTYVEVPTTQYTRLTQGFNNHIVILTSAVHDTNDTANSMAAVTAPTTLATLVTYTNTFRTKVISHFAKGTGAAHPNGADTTNTVTGASTTLPTARGLVLSLRAAIQAHKRLNTTQAHASPGDNSYTSKTANSIIPWATPNTGDNTAAVASYAVALASTWDHHLPRVLISSKYHAATGAANIMVSRTSATFEELKTMVNDAADRFEAHCANKVLETGSSVTFHRVADDAGKVPFRASDPLTTIQMIDYLSWAYYTHTVDGTRNSHHGSTGAGGSVNNTGTAAFLPNSTMTRLQFALLDNLSDKDTALPPNTLSPVVYMLRRGGFSPA